MGTCLKLFELMKKISQLVDTSDEWIVERTGIKTRRIAGDDETAASMAVIAAKQAIEMAGIEAGEIDLIIVATGSPDRVYPSTACIVPASVRSL